MIFPEIMSEMRRPMDFWKGMVRYLSAERWLFLMVSRQILAEALIFSAYLMYGAFVYVCLRFIISLDPRSENSFVSSRNRASSFYH